MLFTYYFTWYMFRYFVCLNLLAVVIYTGHKLWSVWVECCGMTFRKTLLENEFSRKLLDSRSAIENYKIIEVKLLEHIFFCEKQIESMRSEIVEMSRDLLKSGDLTCPLCFEKVGSQWAQI